MHVAACLLLALSGWLFYGACLVSFDGCVTSVLSCLLRADTYVLVFVVRGCVLYVAFSVVCWLL